MSESPKYNPEWAKHGYTEEDHQMDIHGVTLADLHGLCSCLTDETKRVYEPSEDGYVRKCVKCGAIRGKAD